MDTIKFKEGKCYNMSFIGDSNLKVAFVCIKRTAKTAIFESLQGATKEVLKRRIKEYDNCEYVLEGNYSMSPTIKASKEVLFINPNK